MEHLGFHLIVELLYKSSTKDLFAMFTFTIKVYVFSH